MLSHANDRPSEWRDQSSRRVESAGGWHGSETWEEAYRLAHGGWPEGRERIAGALG